MRRNSIRGCWAALAALATTMVLAVAGAGAAEAPTRGSYVDELERICRPDAEATRRAMQGARADVRAERLAVAAEKFGAAASIFSGTVDAMVPVPRPAGDEAKLSRWFGYLRAQESYLQRIAAQLRGGHAIKAQRLTARFIHNGNLANNTVLAFGFDYCSFRFSRYG